MMTLDLTEAELQALAGILATHVRIFDLRAVKDVAAILSKLEAAQPDETDEQPEGEE